MAENKMEQVAALFGKKLGEDFKVKTQYNEIVSCKFTKDGLKCLQKTFMKYVYCYGETLHELIIGKAELVEEWANENLDKSGNPEGSNTTDNTLHHKGQGC